MLDVYYQSSTHLPTKSQKPTAADIGRDALTEAYRLRKHNLNTLSLQGLKQNYNTAERGSANDLNGVSTMPSISSNINKSSTRYNMVQRSSAGIKTGVGSKRAVILNSDM